MILFVTCEKNMLLVQLISHMKGNGLKDQHCYFWPVSRNQFL